ncbi:MAG TPA: AAA family ATPase [Myxococcota bacterium]|nr:AAA family ATPase [Myxococcota bacterium]HQK51564.1 AAA family ATPase [Myxococcota bacterium]
MNRAMLSGPVFVVLEGLDGCGKSTVCGLLADRLGACLLKTPPAGLDDIRGQIDGLLEDRPLARPLFYASMGAWVSEQARRNLQAGIHTVCDRYYLSTLAYAAARGDVVPPDEIQGRLLRPTATFFLDASAEVRRERMRLRGALRREDDRSVEATFESRLLEAYLTLGPAWCPGTWHVIDANRDTPEEVADRIVGLLQLQEVAA